MMELKPRHAENPYQRLSAAVLKQAYSDYTDALAFIRIVDEPSHNPRTERMYDIYYRRAASAAARERPIDMNERIESILSRKYFDAQRTIKSIRKFCLGGMFDLYATSINGDWYLQAMDRVIDDWIECKRKRYAIKEEK